MNWILDNKKKVENCLTYFELKQCKNIIDHLFFTVPKFHTDEWVFEWITRVIFDRLFASFFKEYTYYSL